MSVRLWSRACALLGVVSLFAQSTMAADAAVVERGRYLAKVAGCNDCHTPGYPQAAGDIPETQWLVGSDVGFGGPWGTSYPANLRLYAAGITQDQWIERVRKPMRPPMPWFALRDMSDADVVAIYQFLRTLGPAGQPAPAAAAPGQPVTTAVIDFMPKPVAALANAQR